MEIAFYIISIFKHYLSIVLSWGFHNPIPIENGLRFNVQGILFTGKVEVLYDEGYDLFSIRLLNADGSVKREETGVYLDSLVDVIDGMVERCENYSQMVKETYGLISK